MSLDATLTLHPFIYPLRSAFYLSPYHQIFCPDWLQISKIKCKVFNQYLTLPFWNIRTTAILSEMIYISLSLYLLQVFAQRPPPSCLPTQTMQFKIATWPLHPVSLTLLYYIFIFIFKQNIEFILSIFPQWQISLSTVLINISQHTTQNNNSESRLYLEL